MPKRKKYRGVDSWVNRHGRRVWFFRPSKKKGSKRTRLPDPYGSPAFEAAHAACLAAWLNGQPLPAPAGNGLAQARKASRGKLGWLIRLYLQSPEFQAFRPATRRPRVSMLERLAADKGSVDIEDITRGVIQDSVNARRDTPHMARTWLTTVSNMFAWATRECLEDPLTGESKPVLEANPAEGLKRLPIPKSADLDEEPGHPEFSDEDLATFAAAYPLGTLERRVFSVLLFTGLRLGDAAGLGKQHVQRDGTIKIKTEKTGRYAYIDFGPPLKRALDAGPHGRPEVLNFLTAKRGHAWKKAWLGDWFRERCQAIGLDRSAHGLRKTSARLYAEAGKSEEELMAIFAWKDPAMAHYYVRMANHQRMSLKAQRSMDWDEIENRFSLTSVLGEGMGVKN